MFALVRISSKKNKKFDVLVVNCIDKYSLSIGDSRYEDYTQHHNDIRKTLYETRHRKNEDWDDPLTKGFWSKHLLWNKHTLQESADDIESNYDIKVLFI